MFVMSCQLLYKSARNYCHLLTDDSKGYLIACNVHYVYGDMDYCCYVGTIVV